MTFVNLPKRQLDQAFMLLRKARYLYDFEHETLDFLLAGARFRRLEEGESVFDQGQISDHWYLVLRGRIDTLRYGADGEERVIHHLSEGELLAPVVMFAPQRCYPVSARAAKLSEVCCMHRDRLHEACLRYPRLALKLLELAAVALSLRIDDVDNLAGSSSAQRLAGYLMQLSEKQGKSIELPLSQRQLAARLGMRAETLNRLLAEWQKNGYLTGRRQIWQLHNVAALGRLATR